MTETTKQDIVDAAILLFNEDMSLPLEKVADEAGVTRRTLHRYFRDREELIRSCSEEMIRSCKKAMEMALISSSDPLEQLREMLYASIDCGVKFAFMTKLHSHRDHKHARNKKDCVRYDQAVERIKLVIQALQEKNIISRFITADWAVSFFFGVVATTVNPVPGDGMSHADMKKFAWFSYSKGIGV